VEKGVERCVEVDSGRYAGKLFLFLFAVLDKMFFKEEKLLLPDKIKIYVYQHHCRFRTPCYRVRQGVKEKYFRPFGETKKAKSCSWINYGTRLMDGIINCDVFI
jgi:hypothetical protein